ncbi:unnamed protein product [Cylindrotheca closterium]|uniref:Uncharacterized protein n=1 Tax=Cylindrotheca closterium TaxID=2856 RepID=A0AAD2FJG5_9STRA|nr:unnamed protein product [Cylindrotheca closterium]
MTDQMTAPDSILVSGITSEPGLNGQYVYNGSFRGGKLQWMKPMSRCYIRFIRDRWELYVSHHPSGTTYFYHPDQFMEIPPTSGYIPTPCSGPDEVLSLEYKHKAPPISEYLLYTNKACPFAQQVHIVMQELGIDDDLLQKEQETPSQLKLVERQLVDIFSKNDVDFINSYYKAYPSKTQRPQLFPCLSVYCQTISIFLLPTQVGIFVHAVNREIFPCINSILNSSSLERLESAVDKLMEALGCIETMLKRSEMNMTDSDPNEKSYFLGTVFSLAEAKTAPCFQRLLLVLPGLRPELASVKSLRQFGKDDDQREDDTILLAMIQTKYPTVDKWLGSVFKQPSVVATLYKEDVTEVLKRARVSKFDMPVQSEKQSFTTTKNKMEDLLLSRKMTNP